jgi:hypothetical protein
MTDEVMLDKIRALLAKAEATNFPEEARAFFEGAQRLMVQHSIDEAMLRKTTDSGTPTFKTVLIQAPYLRSKGSLLAVVAKVNNCRVVAPYKTRGGDGTANYTIYGFTNSIQTTEMLYTSLLVQMTSELLDAELDIPRDVHGKTWKNNFLLGFCVEIQKRLETVTQEVVRETGMGLVLLSEAAKVDAFLSATAGRLTTNNRKVRYSAQAYGAGREAGSRANINQRSVSNVKGAIGR